MTRFLTAAAFTLLLTSSALALDCPIPAAISDAASAGAVERILPHGVDLDAPEALQSSVFELKQAGVPEDTILDNLIFAYCSTLSGQQGLTDDEKTQKIEAFSEQADTAVFGDAQ